MYQGGASQYTPIKSLNTFLFDWKIKARVTKKLPKKSWKNARGAGTLLNIELIDFQGTQIQATFFNDQAEKYDEKLKENGVYLFSNGSIKIANKRYTSIQNDYCIVFDRNSEIEEVADDEDIVQQGFSFCSLDEISDFDSMRTIDAIGVITRVDEIKSIQIKGGAAGSKDRRNLTIADESNYTVQVSLWSGLARKEDLKVGQVLALKGTRVSDFGGKSLNSGEEHSQIFLNPKHRRTEQLRKWYEQEGGSEQNFQSLSYQRDSAAGQSGVGSGLEKPDNFKLIEEMIKSFNEG